MEDGSSTAKDEINGALNVTVIIIMPAFVIKKGVVGAEECAVVEGCHV